MNVAFHTLVLLTLLPMLVQAQVVKTERSYRAYPYLSGGSGLISFQGDVAKTGLSTAKPSLNLAAGYSKNLFRAEIQYTSGRVVWNTRSAHFPSNFNASLQGLAFSLFWQPFVPVDERKLAPFASIGIGHLWFSSYTDAQDGQGNYYNYWHDGTIRDKPQLGGNEAGLLSRDFIYETPLAIQQRSIYFPLSLGVSVHLHRSALFHISYSALLLQSDNMDRNTSTPAWDRLFHFSAGLSWRIVKRPESKSALPSNAIEATPRSSMPPAEPLPNDSLFRNVDFEAIVYADEDGDGINDFFDECYGTPAGWQVDAKGCPPDSDKDGIPDQFDLEPMSGSGSWVDKEGRSLSEDALRKSYNDSLSLFTSALRQADKNSRPYHIRKYIPESRYEKFARMLDENPDWRLLHPRKSSLPDHLRMFDLNGDAYISMAELEKAFHRMFEGKDPALSPELFSKALQYVFENIP